MGEKGTMEMSVLDKRLPKYYKGYDMDVIVGKIKNREPLSEEEEIIITEAQRIYYEAYFKRNREQAEKKIQDSIRDGKDIVRTLIGFGCESLDKNLEEGDENES